MSSLNNSRPITVETIGGVYCFFLNEKKDLTLAENFKDFVVGLSSILEANDDAQRKDRMASAYKALLEIKNSLKHWEPDNYRGLDREIRLLRGETAALISDLKGVTSDTLPGLIQSIQKAVKDCFKSPNSAHLKAALLEEAERQKQIVQSDKWSGGLAGLYEIVFKRPGLQQCSVSEQRSGIDYQFLRCFEKPLSILIRSFSPTTEGDSEREGVAALHCLIQQVSRYQELMKDLYLPDSLTGFFITQLHNQHSYVETKDDTRSSKKTDAALWSLYRNIQSAALSQYERADFKEGGLIQFFDQLANEVSDFIPKEKKGESPVVASIITQGLKLQRYHQQSAVLQGSTPLFGNGSSSMQSVEDPYSAKAQKKKEATEKFREKVARSYYENCQLHTAIMSDTGIEDGRFTDPNALAISVVNTLVQHEIARYRYERGIIFLDPARQRALEPQSAKKVILFGLNNDIFTPIQLRTLFNRFNSWISLEDRDIDTAMQQALQRQRAVLAEGQRAFEEAAEELRRLPDAL